jgi:class 3 adenylate cyclase/tetratricopeptide (TPR) repeat protein
MHMIDPIDGILRRLEKPQADVLDLLQAHQVKQEAKYWRRDPRLYRGFAKRLLESGHPTRAVELIRESWEHHPDDRELKYLLALGFARSGNIAQARRYLDELLAVADLEPRLRVEVFSLEGRYYKDRFARAKDPAARKDFAEKSLACYLRAYRVAGDLFPLVNAASMSLLAGRAQQARKLADRVLQQGRLEWRRPGADQQYWLAATLGEAHLILGDVKKTKEWIIKAIGLAGHNVGSLGSTRRNILLLKDKLKLDETVWELFNVGSVVAFSGHMIDHPRRPTRSVAAERFPPDPVLEGLVSQRIRDRLADLNATVGYCSAACGADLLFAERMLERPHAELHVVVPFHLEDFYRTSVDFGLAEMAGWRARFDRVLYEAKQVHYATTEHYLDDDVLFGFANTFLQGLALTRAAERGVEAQALVVLDPLAPPLPGGTAHFLEKWREGGRRDDVIDLAGLRDEAGLPRPAAGERLRAATAAGKGGSIKRRVKVMLFADVKGFSKLAEEHLRLFFFRFLDEVSKVLQASAVKPEFCNTWGDGLFVVFDRVVDGADFALRLLHRVANMDWGDAQFAGALTLRVGLHAGPVYRHRDPVIGRLNYFGSHVNRAARIEPVTTPGCAFASEQFAAALAMEPDHDFVCEFVGVEDLAKGYDRCPLYRLERR